MYNDLHVYTCTCTYMHMHIHVHAHRNVYINVKAVIQSNSPLLGGHFADKIIYMYMYLGHNLTHSTPCLDTPPGSA